MSELRRYEPTARRLQRLRQAGATPHSSAVSGAAVLLGAVVLALLPGRSLWQGLAALLARDLQQAAVASADLPVLLWRHLAVGGAVVVVVAAATAVVSVGAAAAQGALALRPPWRGARERQRRGLDLPALALGLAGLTGSLVIFLSLLGHYREAESWRELASPPLLWGLLWRQLSLLVGLAVLHLLWTRAGYLQRAMLTHSELQEERKESEGSWLKARRRLVARTQWQRRYHSD